MSTPSQRIWAQRAALNDGPGMRERLRGRTRRRESLADVATRIADGEELRAAVAEFMDATNLIVDAGEMQQRLSDEPRSVDARTDAYLAAVAEYVAAKWGIPVPDWAVAPGRFLSRFWWPSPFVGLRARALVESPAAFRRRGIFIGKTTLQRV